MGLGIVGLPVWLQKWVRVRVRVRVRQVITADEAQPTENKVRVRVRKLGVSA